MGMKDSFKKRYPDLYENKLYCATKNIDVRDTVAKFDKLPGEDGEAIIGFEREHGVVRMYLSKTFSDDLKQMQKSIEDGCSLIMTPAGSVGLILSAYRFFLGGESLMKCIIRGRVYTYTTPYMIECFKRYQDFKNKKQN